jgi:hypothetical protein
MHAPARGAHNWSLNPSFLLRVLRKSAAACPCRTYLSGERRAVWSMHPANAADPVDPTSIESNHASPPFQSQAQCTTAMPRCRVNSRNAKPLIASSQALSYPLCQLPLAILPRVHEPLLGEFDVLHRGHVLRGGPANARGHGYGVGLQDDTVVYQFVDGKGLHALAVDSTSQQHRRTTYHQVVLDHGALVNRVPGWFSVQSASLSRHSLEEDVERVSQGQDNTARALVRRHRGRSRACRTRIEAPRSPPGRQRHRA